MLICTGALTNAALLLSLYPELAPRVRVVLMGARARTTHAGAKQRRIVARRGGAGGAMGRGNTGPVSEFNIQARSSERRWGQMWHALRLRARLRALGAARASESAQSCPPVPSAPRHRERRAWSAVRTIHRSFD